MRKILIDMSEDMVLSFVKSLTRYSGCGQFEQINYSSAADRMWASIIEFANRALEPLGV